MKGLLVCALLLVIDGCASKQGPRTPTAAAQPAREQPSSTANLAAVRQLIDDAKALSRERQDQRAETTARQAAQLASALSPQDPLLLSEALAQLASCLVLLKRTDEARQLVQRGLALAEGGTLEGQKRRFQLQMSLAESFRYENRPELAIAPFRAAIEAASLPQHEQELASRHAEGSRRLAATLNGLRRHAEATAALESALQVAQRHGQEDDRARLAMQLAFSYVELHGVEKALTLLKALGVRGRRLRTDAMAFSDAPVEEFLPSPPTGAAGSQPAATPTTTTPPAPLPPPARNTPAVSNAAQRVEEMRADFRTCYQTSLEADPYLRGTARIVIKVAADGRVAEVKTLGIGLHVDTVDCLLRRAATAQFDPPEGGSAVIAVPVSFVQR